MRDYGENCLFDPEVKCPVHGIEINGPLCQACVAQGMFVLTEFMTTMQHNSIRVTKMGMIFRLLESFQTVDEAKKWFDKVSALAGEWKFPWEEEEPPEDRNNQEST